jgi:hypothetical protein
MKEIILDCFKTDDSCSVISLDKNLVLNDAKAQDFSVLVFNHSSADCQLLTTVRSHEQAELAKFLQQRAQSLIIEAGRSRKYFFNFDFLSLVMEKRKVSAKFDLVIDFKCTDVVKIAVPSPSNTSVAQGSVLADKNSSMSAQVATDGNLSGQPQFWFSAYFYFLSSLFILIFFVIIKIVNGKKKKSQA